MKAKGLFAAFMLCGAISCAELETIDVLVVGGGASGVTAAVQSARMGVDVMLLEEGPWLGGMLTSAGVSCIDGNYNLRSGIFGEFLDSLAAHYGGYDALKTGWVSNVCFEPQVGQEIFTAMTQAYADRLKVERGMRLKSVSAEGNDWIVAFTDGNGRRRKVMADVLIDATELGDVAAMCGVGYSVGMDSFADTGESIAPAEENDVIQDLTVVAVLKDYGAGADMTIPRPEGYDPSIYADCCVNPLNRNEGKTDTGQVIWPADQMLQYAAAASTVKKASPSMRRDSL